MNKAKQDIKLQKTLFEVDDSKAVIMAWLKESTSNPTDYLTSAGMAYLNGYLQSNNTVGLVKSESYDELLNNYKDLINKYEHQKKLNQVFDVPIIRLFVRLYNKYL